MKLIRWLMIMANILVGLSTSANDEIPKWYAGIIHAHSTFSDGDRTPSMLKGAAAKLGYSFLVVSDHWSSLSKKTKLTGVVTDDYGLDKYLEDFSQGPRVQGQSYNLIVIPGAEFTAFRGKATAHIVGIGRLKDLPKDIGSSQQDVLATLSSKGFLTIAAHPNWVSSLHDYSFDPNHTEGLCGIEFGNDGEGFPKTLALYRKLIKSGKKVFATGGCDSHTSTDITVLDAKRWLRKTVVWCKGKITKEKLLLAIKNGQTYASLDGSYFNDSMCNIFPQFDYQEVDRPTFTFGITFNQTTKKSKEIRVYRDGDLVSDSVAKVASGLRQFKYSWTDKRATAGEHSYFIEVTDSLITSPIYLRIKKATSSEGMGGYDDWHPQPISSSDVAYDFFSGNGKRIAFLSNRGGEQALYFADINNGISSSVRKVRAGLTKFYDGFEVSPACDFILFLAKNNTIYCLILDLKTREPKELVSLKLKASPEFFPSWLNNETIVFADESGRIKKAFIQQVITDTQQDLPIKLGDLGQKLGNLAKKLGINTRKTGFVVKVNDFSPDDLFLTSRKDNSLTKLCLINPQGKVAKWLKTVSGNCQNPTVGKTGTLSFVGTASGPVVFISDKTGHWQIYRCQLVSQSVSAISQVSRSETDDTFPCWAFFTQKIYFTTTINGQKRIGLMNADGSSRQILGLK